MNEIEKDEIDLLAEAEEDLTPIWDATRELKDLHSARAAIFNLVGRGFISLWWVKHWGSVQKELLTEARIQSAMSDLKEDKYWVPNDEPSSGYYAFYCTEKGRNFYQTDPTVSSYMKEEWCRRKIKRGQMRPNIGG